MLDPNPTVHIMSEHGRGEWPDGPEQNFLFGTSFDVINRVKRPLPLFTDVLSGGVFFFAVTDVESGLQRREFPARGAAWADSPPALALLFYTLWPQACFEAISHSWPAVPNRSLTLPMSERLGFPCRLVLGTACVDLASRPFRSRRVKNPWR